MFYEKKLAWFGILINSIKFLQPCSHLAIHNSLAFVLPQGETNKGSV